MKVYSFSDSKYCKAVFFSWAEHQQQAEWGSWATFGLIPSTSHGTVSNVQPKLPLADSGTQWCQCTLACLHGPLQFLPFGAATLTTKTVFFSFDIFSGIGTSLSPKSPIAWVRLLYCLGFARNTGSWASYICNAIHGSSCTNSKQLSWAFSQAQVHALQL